MTILITEQPTTFGVEWSRLQRLQLAIFEANVDLRSCFSDQICWTAGLYFGHTLFKRMIKGENPFWDYKIGRLEKLCKITAKRLDKVFHSKNVNQWLAIACEHNRDFRITPSTQMGHTFFELDNNDSEWLPKIAIKFLKEEPQVENRIRFYFGLGVSSILGFHRNSSVWDYIEDGGQFLVPDDDGSKTSRLRGFIIEEFSFRID